MACPFPVSVIESKTLQGDSGEHSFGAPGTFVIENTTVEFQKGAERETIKIPGPLGADFIIKVRCCLPRLCSLKIWLPTQLKQLCLKRTATAKGREGGREEEAEQLN